MNVSVTSRRSELIEMLPRLRRFARALTRHVADADDLVQLGLERALMTIDTLAADSRLDSWMFRVMRNAWIDETRRRSRWDRVLAPEEAGAAVGDATSEADFALISIQRAMEKLPDEQRIAVALVLVEGLSYRDAANVVGVPIGTLTSRLARGREALQDLLTDDYGIRK